MTLCPWCGAERPAYLLATVDVYAIDEEETLAPVKKAITGFCVQSPGTFGVTRRHLGYYDSESDQLLLDLEIDARQIIIRNSSGKECFATHHEWKYEQGKENGGRIENIDRRKKSFRDSWMVHIGSLTKAHPVIRFQYIG
jgi:hypothetical protein